MQFNKIRYGCGSLVSSGYPAAAYCYTTQIDIEISNVPFMSIKETSGRRSPLTRAKSTNHRAQIKIGARARKERRRPLARRSINFEPHILQMKNAGSHSPCARRGLIQGKDYFKPNPRFCRAWLMTPTQPKRRRCRRYTRPPAPPLVYSGFTK